MRNAFIGEVLAATAERDDVFVISGDAGLGVFDEFKVEHADRFLNLGVAEQNMIGMAAGMALTGSKVFVYNIIPFVLYRCYEQVRNDVCYQELPVTLVGIGSGLTYSPQGMTHYSIEDIAIAATLPNLRIISPADPVEARAAARFALDSPDAVYVRLAKRGEPGIHPAAVADITRPIVVSQGRRVALLFHGSISTDVIEAASALRQDGLDPLVVSVPMLQPLATDELFDLLDGFEHVFTVEEHYRDSGLGAMVAVECARRRPSWALHTLGVDHAFVHDIRNQAGMREHFGISAERIAGSVRSAVGGG